jgi:hypothetical protein
LNQHNWDDAPQNVAVFVCTCNTQRSLLLNQHNWDDAPQNVAVFVCTCNTQNSLILNQHNWHDAPQEVCFDFLYKILSEIVSIPRRIKRDIIKNVHRSSCKVPIILVIFRETLIFYTHLLKKVTQIPNFMKFHPVGAEPFHADGRTDEETEIMKPLFAISCKMLL